MRTVPVNQAAGPLLEGCDPILLISIFVSSVCLCANAQQRRTADRCGGGYSDEAAARDSHEVG
jgi:hypothetical protein